MVEALLVKSRKPVEWPGDWLLSHDKQNGAIVRTDSVRTKAYLQNSETCMRNLHW